MALGLMSNRTAALISHSGFFYGFYGFRPSLVEALQQSIYGVMVNNGTPTYDMVLWTMRIEFMGSLLIFAVLGLAGQARLRWIVYLALSVVFFNTYYLSFLLGMALSDAVSNAPRVITFLSKRTVKYSLLVLGLYFGSVPVLELPGFPGSSWYNFLKIPGLNLDWYSLYHNIGAPMLVLFVILSARVQVFLNKGIFQWLGKVSYPVYLIHLVIICSLSSFVFVGLVPHVKYDMAFLLSLLSGFAATAIVAEVFHKLVDAQAIRLAREFGRLALGSRSKELHETELGA